LAIKLAIKLAILMTKQHLGYNLKGHAIATGEGGRVPPQIMGIQVMPSFLYKDFLF